MTFRIHGQCFDIPQVELAIWVGDWLGFNQNKSGSPKVDAFVRAMTKAQWEIAARK